VAIYSETDAATAETSEDKGHLEAGAAHVPLVEKGSLDDAERI
jgi:hypothetical protein